MWMFIWTMIAFYKFHSLEVIFFSFFLQCIPTNKSPHNILTRLVSPRPWWSRTPTASAPSVPCPQARRWVWSPHVLQTTVRCTFWPSLSCWLFGIFAWWSELNLLHILIWIPLKSSLHTLKHTPTAECRQSQLERERECVCVMIFCWLV